MSNGTLNPVPIAQSGPDLLEDAAWFDVNWMWFSTAFVPMSLLLVCLAFRGSFWGKLQNPYVIGWLTIPAYCIHQTEEHGYDLRRWRYAFVPNFNHVLGPILFPECEQYISCPLDPRLTTAVNTSAIWFGFAVTMTLAHYFGPQYAYAGHFNWGTAIVNAFGGHLLPWALVGYNPGAFQSLFMFSFGVWAISRGGAKFAAACVACGVAFHAVCFGLGIKALMRLGLPLVLDAVPCFAMTTALPLLLARLVPADVSRVYSSADEETGENTD